MSESGSGREQLLSKAFVGLADTLVDDYDVIDLLDRLMSYRVELLAADGAGLLLADSQRTLRVVASSHEDAELMELLQLQADQGPRRAEPSSRPAVSSASRRRSRPVPY